jgi:metabolite-proton symporter
MSAGRDARTVRRVAVASFVGTTIEWYDFFIYGTAAALVLGKQFFPTASTLTATLAAFATFSVGFVARPLGGLVMGHYGDRIGRKSMLVTSLLTMGAATFLIGVLPNYATLGVAAPILLVVLRFVQGFGVGGEWGGAVLMSVEHAPPARRAFYGAFPQMGLPAGIILSTLVYLVIGSMVPQDQFAVWGWRIPFLLSAVLIVFGLVLRLKVTETPEFRAVRDQRRVTRMPLVEVMRTEPRAVIAGSVASIAAPALGYLILVYLLSYGTRQLGIPNTTMLWIIVVSAVVWLGVILLCASLADRTGRRPVFLGGAILAAVWAFPFFLLVDTGSVLWMLLGTAVAATAVAAMAGPQAALLAALFPARVRYSGTSLAYQVGSVLGGAIAPLAATALLAATKTSLAVAGYMAAMAVVSLLGVLALPDEGKRHDDEQAGAAPGAVSGDGNPELESSTPT